ncbi:GGDEF domain-containing protein [Buttiauxella warmboldiae]|uniref:diguanylate cyclase n=1 Tax=Buttiauxella warmboldiae TaxID=82993 RepID=A0A3N5DQQ0_9ENTR|nr:sensor domain-containing diguanylate cyclase [Buttiauxella warmboldiae]RPH29531.1 GGDEF domain-containing protein [Buttiauxella warmboldiae]
MKITTNKAVTILMFIMLIPFVFISACAFFYIKNITTNTFFETMTRVTENTAQSCIEQQSDEIKLVLKSLSENLDDHNITEFTSNERTELHKIIPSIINSTIFFKGALISSVDGHYKLYPQSIKINNFQPNKKQWQPYLGMKSETFFSNPYIPVVGSDIDENSNMLITASTNVFDAQSEIKGSIVLKLDLKKMSRILQSKIIPYGGHFKVATRSGNVIMHANANEILSTKVPALWVKNSTELYGNFYDAETKSIIFYRTYNNPDWIAFTIVSQESYNHAIYSSYTLLFAVIATCIVLYLIIFLLHRIYFKQLLSMLYMNVNGVEICDERATFENISSSIIQKQKKLEFAENLSMIDELTKLGTRRKFNTDIQELIENETCFYLAMIDLDNFKFINDNFGHQTGDSVLKYVSQSGVRVISNAGQLYRFGGEEITVLFTIHNFKEVYKLLDKWRSGIFEKKWREENITVSFSCGITKWNSGETSDQILEKADKLLYKAKRAGKNCIISSGYWS